MAQAKYAVSYTEYLSLEAGSQQKHEYLRGEVWAMAGGTAAHALIATNFTGVLRNALQGKPCAPYNSDLRIRISETDRTTYPDAVVVCGKREMAADDPNALTNPTVIVEVLSESTEASDRGEKFAHYRQLNSLKEYVLVSQHLRQVEVFRRGDNDGWSIEPARIAGERVELTSLGVSFAVDELYVDPNA